MFHFFQLYNNYFVQFVLFFIEYNYLKKINKYNNNIIVIDIVAPSTDNDRTKVSSLVKDINKIFKFFSSINSNMYFKQIPTLLK